MVKSVQESLVTSDATIKNLLQQIEELKDQLYAKGIVIEDLRRENKVYSWGFSISAGRLYAHAKPDCDPMEFTEQILAEARDELAKHQKEHG